MRRRRPASAPKRRRSRRGKKKEPRDETKPAVADEACCGRGRLPVRQSPGRDQTWPKDKRIAEPESAEDEDRRATKTASSDDDRPARQGFRSIPTWEEAVGLVIAKNLEARSKRGGGGDGGGGTRAKHAAAVATRAKAHGKRGGRAAGGGGKRRS